MNKLNFSVIQQFTSLVIQRYLLRQKHKQKMFSTFDCHCYYSGLFWKRKQIFPRERVTTTKIRTSKFKKNIENVSKHQNIESVFLVHHYYDNQNVKKNIKIKTFDVLILPMASKKIRTSKIENINYLWRITYGYQGLWGVRLGSVRLG